MRLTTSKLYRTTSRTPSCWLAIHGSLELAGTESAADPVIVRVCHFKGLRSLGHVRSLDTAPPSLLKLPVDWAAIKVLRFPGDSTTRFRGIVIILDFDRKVFLETAPLSVSIAKESWRQRHSRC
jgi:hypothetical protein